ncbi:MAG: energy-coupling factor transporter transmembrane component T [Oscillospiraceae bacterium]
MNDAFSRGHPAVNFLFFGFAIIFAMFFVHPLFLMISVFLSLSYYLLLKGREGIKTIFGALLFCGLLSLVNPLLNPLGDTVLFIYLGTRPFTLESLLYGIATSGMFLTVIFWFSCYNSIMTGDKFIYLFGKGIPAISLVFSMVMRLVPNLQRKILSITNARACVGKENAATKMSRLQNGMTVLSVLSSWALESAITTADSMKSRGYGTGVRTVFPNYRIQKRDIFVLAVIGVSGTTLLIGMLHGATEIAYLPALQMPPLDIYTIIASMGYGILLSIPCFLHIEEELVWHILKLSI